MLERQSIQSDAIALEVSKKTISGTTLIVYAARRYLQNEIGKPVCGIKPAGRLCRHRHGREPLDRKSVV